MRVHFSRGSNSVSSSRHTCGVAAMHAFSWVSRRGVERGRGGEERRGERGEERRGEERRGEERRGEERRGEERRGEERRGEEGRGGEGRGGERRGEERRGEERRGEERRGEERRGEERRGEERRGEEGRRRGGEDEVKRRNTDTQVSSDTHKPLNLTGLLPAYGRPPSGCCTTLPHMPLPCPTSE